MIISYHWDGENFRELREPTAKWYSRFTQFFKILQDCQGNPEKYTAILHLLGDLLIEAKVTNDLIPVESMDIVFINNILELFAPKELPDLSELVELLEDKSNSSKYIQSSNNSDAFWLNTLFNLFGKKAMVIWESVPMSVVQALVFEARQSLLLNSVRDKLTEAAIQNREIEREMRDKVRKGDAFPWLQAQIYPQIEVGGLDDLKLE